MAVVVEVAALDAVVLDGVVDDVDVVVAGGCDRERRPHRLVLPPGVDDGGEVVVEGAGVDGAVLAVVVDDGGVTFAESEGGVGFPGVGEAVELVEFDGEPGGAEFVEHAASADGVELVGVADECEPPSESVCVVDELVKVRGVEHSGFVDHDRRPRCRRFESGGLVAEVVEEFGDGVGWHPGFGVQDLGCFCSGCESEDVSVLLVEVDGGGG